MLTLFSRKCRRPAARRPFTRQLSVECLEGRDAPSSLADPSQLTTPDTTDTTAALTASAPATTTTDTTSAPASTTSGTTGTPVTTSTDTTAAPATTTTTTSAPATSTTTTTSAPATTMTTPATVPALASSGGSGGMAAAPADSSTPSGPTGTNPPAATAPVIDNYTVSENIGTWTYTIYGHVTYANPTSLTVNFSGAELQGQQAAVDSNGNFQIAFQLPPCTSTATANHSYGAVATDGQGNTSAEVIILVQQTVLPNS